jgi:hypothetical protein
MRNRDRTLRDACLRWERFRIVLNVLLAVEVLALMARQRISPLYLLDFTDPGVMLSWLFLGVYVALSNALLSIGPILEIHMLAVHGWRIPANRWLWPLLPAAAVCAASGYLGFMLAVQR